MAMEHHVGMKITVRPGQQTEVEMHHMPIPGQSAGPMAGSGAPPQGMVPDPMAAGAKSAMDAVLPSSQPEVANAGVDKRQAERMGSEQGRTTPKKPETAVGKPPKTKEKTPAKKPDGKLPAKKPQTKEKPKKP